MTKYEELLDRAVDEGCIVKEVDFKAYDGLIVGNKIGIRKTIPTTRQKTSVLGEELSHYLLTVGNILDQSDANNRKQEHSARQLAHNMLIGLDGFIKAYEHGCRNVDEFTNAVGQEAPTSISRGRNARFCGVFPF